MKFEPKLLDKPLTPIAALEWRCDLAQWIKSHTDELAISHFQLQKRPSGTVSRHEAQEVAAIYHQGASMLTKAEILLWDKSMKDFALSGRKLFYGYQTSDLLSRQPELWVNNYDMCSNMPQPEPGMINVGRQAILLWPDLDSEELLIWGYHFRTYYERWKPPYITHYTLSTKYRIPATEKEITEVDDNFLQLISGVEFLRSSIVTSEQEALPRKIRRQAEREIKHEPIVRVIRLRRKERAQSSGSGGPIDWQNQWLVRPHWRNQYHPSTGERKPVFIDAYIKGPEDKPFKPPKDYVFKVDR